MAAVSFVAIANPAVRPVINRPRDSPTCGDASDANHEGEREAGEQRLLDVHPRVEDHRGGERHQHRRGHDGGPANPGREQRQQQDRCRAEHRRDASECRFVEQRQRVLAAQPGRWQRQVVERRAVVIASVVAVLAVLEQCPELDRLVRLVVVHRPLGQPGGAQGEPGRQCQRDERTRDGASHLARP